MALPIDARDCYPNAVNQDDEDFIILLHSAVVYKKELEFSAAFQPQIRL
jgi:hypothetical protein